MNYRLSDGVSIPRVHRELAKLNLSGLKLSTINEFKLALKNFLKFVGKEELAKKIKRKEVKDNELMKEDLLSVDDHVPPGFGLQAGGVELRKELSEKFKVKKIGVFGSFVGGEQKKGGDVDILVEFEETPIGERILKEVVYI